MILRKIWKRIKEQYTSLPNVEIVNSPRFHMIRDPCTEAGRSLQSICMALHSYTISGLLLLLSGLIYYQLRN